MIDELSKGAKRLYKITACMHSHIKFSHHKHVKCKKTIRYSLERILKYSIQYMQNIEFLKGEDLL